MTEPTPLLQMQDIRKRFGATHALCGVSLDVAAGQVMALIGENGAGKSTLVKVLSGAITADAGSMRLEGRPYRPRGPHDARRAGVAMIYQELNLAPQMSVEDNIMLGQEESWLGLVDRQHQHARVRDALALLGHRELRLEAEVRSLSVGAQQLVEIARALVMDARLIVFDEPTSSLTLHDVERLFDVIGKLKAAGLGVVYISHFLEEVRQVCDSFTVLRDGQTVGGGALADVGEEDIIAMMVGRGVDNLFPTVPHTPSGEILSLASLSGRHQPRGVSLSLRRGEILGIAGLIGAGRTELLRTIFALDPLQRGRVLVRGLATAHSPHARIAAGLGMVSEDRKAEGLAQTCSIADNISFSRLAPYSLFGMLDLPRRDRAIEFWTDRLRIGARSSRQEVQRLSGGNQQKVALARIMHQDADVLLLDEPTRGIDVGTKAEIYQLIGELAAAGKAIILVSSYLPELMAVCDRVGVMVRGRLREIRPTDQWTEEEIMACAIGVEEGDTSA